jgi:hypothetical protein
VEGGLWFGYFEVGTEEQGETVQQCWQLVVLVRWDDLIEVRMGVLVGIMGVLVYRVVVRDYGGYCYVVWCDRSGGTVVCGVGSCYPVGPVCCRGLLESNSSMSSFTGGEVSEALSSLERLRLFGSGMRSRVSFSSSEVINRF